MQRDFEQMMRQALEERASGIEPSAQMLANIKKEAEGRKERKGMKHLGMKKMMAAVAAVCILSVTCYAASQVSGVIAGSRADIHTLEGLQRAESKLDFEAKYVEEFSNGMKFRIAGLGKTQGLDENGNRMGKVYQMLTVDYADEGGRNVSLTIEGGNHFVDAGEENVMGYVTNTYKFVPPDYEKTAEDLKKEAAGELNISYGTDKVEINEVEYYGWEDEGVYYSLTGFDCNLGEAELARMAAEIQAE